MRKRLWIGIAAALAVLIGLAASGYWIKFQTNRDALWHIVSQECVPGQKNHQNPEPCLKVDLDQGYVLFKDRQGPHHDLLMPVKQIEGLESEQLVQDLSPNFIALAWAQRQRLIQEAKRSIPDDWFALAVNSRQGRTQDQFHIHVACLRADVHRSLNQMMNDVGFEWTPLPGRLNRQHYWARRLEHDDLQIVNPIDLLNQHLQAIHKQPGDHGLALVKLQDGDFVLLSTGVNLLALDLGSAGRIQEYTCDHQP